jgi:hypothetical protein
MRKNMTSTNTSVGDFRRAWNQNSVGVVERVSGFRDDQEGVRSLEADITFRSLYECKIEPGLMSLGWQEGQARKALWRHVHAGLDEALYALLNDIVRAVACTPPGDQAQIYLKNAADRAKALIDHVLGNEPGEIEAMIGNVNTATTEHKRNTYGSL